MNKTDRYDGISVKVVDITGKHHYVTQEEFMKRTALIETGKK